MRVITYAVGDRYRAAARVLQLSGEAVGVPVEILDVEPAEGWGANTRQKAALVCSVLEKDDALWLDADCIIHKDPRPHLESIYGIDVALYMERVGTINGSVAYFRKTERGRAVAAEWKRLIDMNPAEESDPPLLESTQVGCRLYHLSPEYCWVEAAMRRRFPKMRPAVEALMIHTNGGRS